MSFKGSITIFTSTEGDDLFNLQTSERESKIIANFFKYGYRPYVSTNRPPFVSELRHVQGFVGQLIEHPVWGTQLKFHPVNEADPKKKVLVLIYFNDPVEELGVCDFFTGVGLGNLKGFEAPEFDFMKPGLPQKSQEMFLPKRVVISPTEVRELDDPLTEKEMEWLLE
jgi:hypothetical protein